MKNWFSIVLIFIIPNFGISQHLNTTFFEGNSISKLDHIFDHIEMTDGIIVSGKKDSNPGIIKIDVNGNIIWSTWETTNLNQSYCNDFNIELFKDGFIYGTSYNLSNKTLWKVDPQSGEVLWTKFWYSDQVSSNVKPVDYDSTTFIVTFKHSNFTSALSKVNKETGDTLSTTYFPLDFVSNNLTESDDNKNIYFVNNLKLIKFNKDNLDQKLWETNLNSFTPNVLDVNHVYFDDSDNIIIFSKTTSKNHITKIDISTGQIVWDSQIIFSDVKVRDFIDKNNKLYVAYRHIYVGGGSYNLSTLKVDKSTGDIEWSTYNQFEIGNSNEQSGMSMDIDCDNNLYLTGYFDDVNYGPNEWGIIKLNGLDGTTMYSTHIDYDSSYDDSKSVGLVTCLFQNQPIFLGHREETPGEYEPLLVKTDATTGNIVYEKHLGSSYTNQSKTISLQKEDNYIYIFKQFAKKLIIEKIDQDSQLIWEKNIDNGSFVIGNNISINTSSIYLSARKPYPTSFPPYYNDSTEYLYIYELNKDNGTLISSDSLLVGGEVSRGIELESDNGQAFLFYTNDSLTKLVKWTNVGFSTPITIDSTGPNTEYLGNLNMVNNYSSASLLYFGKYNLKQIDKSSLAINSSFNYGSPIYSFDHSLQNDTLTICGEYGANQRIEMINLNGLAPIYSNTYNTGTFNQLEFNPSLNELYIAGSISGHPTLHFLDALTGNENSIEYIDSSIFNNSTPLTFTFNTQKSYLAIAGMNYADSNKSDLMIGLYDLISGNQFSFLGEDNHDLMSLGCTSLISPNSNLFIGGSYNNALHSRAGFISVYDYGSTENNISEFACDNFIAPSGVLYSSTGIYLDTIQNYFGCDSIISIDLSIQNSVSNTINVQSVDSYTTPSGNYTYTTSGTYTDTLVSINNGCDSILIINLSMEFTELNVNRNSEIQFFPNPSNGQFKIILNNYNNVSIKVISSLGTILFEENGIHYNEYQLKLNQAPGIYILEVRYNQIKEQFKLVIE